MKLPIESAPSREIGVQLLGDIEATTSSVLIDEAVREQGRLFSSGLLARAARFVLRATAPYVS